MPPLMKYLEDGCSDVRAIDLFLFEDWLPSYVVEDC